MSEVKFNPNDFTESRPTVIRKLNEKDTSFVSTVFNSNFIRLIDPNVYHFSSLYAEKKRNSSIHDLTDTFWFEAHKECRDIYHKLPMVYPFIEQVQQHINNQLPGILLIDRKHPFEKATGIELRRRKTFETFNEFLEFLHDVNVLARLPDDNGPTRFSMEGYCRFRIVRE